MVGISDYRPISVPTGTIELRVHGVSGTPPESLIKAAPTLVAGTTTAGFYRTVPTSGLLGAESPGVREGYAWGGLTSGTRISSALRLLLLPFSLVNVAGWMLPGERDPRDGAPTRPADAAKASARAAAHALGSRLLAVCLTAYVTLGAMWVATATAHRGVATHDVPLIAAPAAQARATMLAVLILIALWVVASRRTAVGPTRGTAPSSASRAPATAAARPEIDVSTLWDGSATTPRLSGIHAAVAISSATLLTYAAFDAHGALASAGLALAWLSIGLAVIGLVALVGAGTWGKALTKLVRATTVPTALLAAAIALSQGGSALTAQDLQDRVGHALTLGMSALSVAVGALVIAQVAAGPGGGPLAGRLYASAFTVIGFGAAITGVSGLAVIVTWLLGGRDYAAFVTGLAQTIAILGITSCAAFLIVALLRLNPATGLASIAWFARLRDTVAHARGAIVTGAVVFAVGANAIAAMYLVRRAVIDPAGLEEGERGWASWGWFVLAAVVAAIGASRLPSWGARIVGTAVGAVVVTLVALYGGALVAAVLAHRSVGEQVENIIAASDQWFVVAAVVTALVTPMAAVIAYMWRGSKDQSTRRLVGVVWDLVNFWPRQFHPWAPPPYTDTTIPDLADRVKSLAETSGASTIIVSAHSQGAIIAVPALSRLFASGGAGPARVALLTYGQLLDSHYRWLFPWVFNPDLFTEVDSALNHRWINLYRITDPLGQPVRALDPARDREIAEGLELSVGGTAHPKTLNHGDYWYSASVYSAALTQLSRPDA